MKGKRSGPIAAYVQRKKILWITGSWLSSFVLARRAGMKADFPREYDARKIPHGADAFAADADTDSFLVHVHSDFWKSKTICHERGARSCVGCRRCRYPWTRKPLLEQGWSMLIEGGSHPQSRCPICDLKVGDTFHYVVPSATPRSWGSILEVKGGTVIAVDQDNGRRLWPIQWAPAIRCRALIRWKTILRTCQWL